MARNSRRFVIGAWRGRRRRGGGGVDAPATVDEAVGAPLVTRHRVTAWRVGIAVIVLSALTAGSSGASAGGVVPATLTGAQAVAFLAAANHRAQALRGVLVTETGSMLAERSPGGLFFLAGGLTSTGAAGLEPARESISLALTGGRVTGYLDTARTASGVRFRVLVNAAGDVFTTVDQPASGCWMRARRRLPALWALHQPYVAFAVPPATALIRRGDAVSVHQHYATANAYFASSMASTGAIVDEADTVSATTMLVRHSVLRVRSGGHRFVVNARFQALAGRPRLPRPTPVCTRGVPRVSLVAMPGLQAPAGITSGPDGSIWFAVANPAAIARISRRGVITLIRRGISPASHPAGLTTSPDGSTWFTELYAGQVGSISPRGALRFAGGVTPGAGADGIVSAVDGSIWFTEPYAARLGRVSPSGHVTEYSRGMQARAYPGAITSGPDGNVWFTEALTDAVGGGLIGRADSAGAITPVAWIGSRGTYPLGITTGPDGNVWFTIPGADAIGRVTRSGVVSEFTTGVTPGAYPVGITTASDGNLWFTEAYGGLGRITPRGLITEFTTAAASGDQITAGADNSVWFTNPAAGSVVRVSLPRQQP